MSGSLIAFILAFVFFVMAGFGWPQPFKNPVHWEFIAVAFVVLGALILK